jgi:hypothetical protein
VKALPKAKEVERKQAVVVAVPADTLVAPGNRQDLARPDALPAKDGR